jgi:hypothetical protein
MIVMMMVTNEMKKTKYACLDSIEQAAEEEEDRVNYV